MDSYDKKYIYKKCPKCKGINEKEKKEFENKIIEIENKYGKISLEEFKPLISELNYTKSRLNDLERNTVCFEEYNYNLILTKDGKIKAQGFGWCENCGLSFSDER